MAEGRSMYASNAGYQGIFINNAAHPHSSCRTLIFHAGYDSSYPSREDEDEDQRQYFNDQRDHGPPYDTQDNFEGMCCCCFYHCVLDYQ